MSETVEEILQTGEASDPANTTEVIQLPDPAARSIMTTPLDDYTVTEGLLLCVLLTLIVGGVINFLKGVF